MRKETLLEGDEVYVDFCMRAMKLREYIFEKYGISFEGYKRKMGK